MQIYLLNKTPFEGVKNLILNEIVFFDIDINLHQYNALICTSKNALLALEKSKVPLNLDIEIYTIGESAACLAKKLGFKNIKIAKKSYANEFFKEFKEELKNKKCLYLRAKTIASTLNLDLKNSGIDLDELIVYENVFKSSNEKLIHPSIFIFTSALSVENFLKNYTLYEDDIAISIGKSTAKKLLNFKNLFVCEKQSIKECVILAKKLSLKANF
ncbi:uroporphyrinogen-III synthase [Campylobacter estrildidarum]|uniref:Uroporphyrinogen-III synthase n=1 Tax=Campylobacter estrildidarum TaxID=2510189 RepID=A0A4U7BRZ9_9BACT|nr:uroporphyrinogen-III synthase [Campylobacter estrildidarum]TKX31736.1 uroporphyrinogen-III synthase [Campylobacter estrildidarum]